MKNPEQSLLLELQASCGGKPLPSAVWKNYAGMVASALGGQGSQNWPLMAAAVKYRETGDQGQLPEFFDASRTCFMGTEPFSPEYGRWGHMLAVAAIHDHAVKHGDFDMAVAALEWLRFYWGVIRLCTAPDGSVLTVGWRGSPWQLPEREATWIAWTRDQALGVSIDRWLAAGHRLNLAMPQQPAYAVAQSVAGSIATAIRDFSPLPEYRMMTSLHALRGADDWLAVYLESNGNGNTPPLMAAVWNHGEVSYLPKGAGSLFRVRQILDKGRVAQDGDRLVFNSSIYGPSEVTLPSTAFTETVVGNDTEMAISGGQTLGPVPAPMVPGSSGAIDFAGAADVVEGLTVPNRQQGLRHSLAAELRAWPNASERRPLGAIAVDIASLGIGEGQGQAAAWHAVVDQLRSAVVS